MLRATGLVLLLAVFFTAGCGGVRRDFPRTPSKAYANFGSTTLGRLTETRAARHPGKSGFQIIRYGHNALAARIAMIGMAEKSLDIQYYLWHPDETGRLMSDAVLAAADRGVKVRVLLDDMGLDGRDNEIAALDAHPNIEIRVFNPFPHRGLHALGFLSDFKRVNHRMHNKMIIADNAVAILGGRNIGNHYFGAGRHGNFRDLDAAAAGPVVRDISKVYDYFWNGEWSVPVGAFAGKRRDARDLESIRQRISRQIADSKNTVVGAGDIRRLRARMDSLLDDFVWAHGEIVWNDPRQMRMEKEARSGTILRKLNARVRTLKKSLYIESPYFIPGKQGTATLIALAKRGVKVRILTNSIDANDVLPAHAGYTKYRAELARNGVDLYELRADAGENRIIDRNPSSAEARAKSGLHAKTIVFDAKDTFIGSFNLDPRSADINTETGLYIENREISRQVMAFMDEALKPENSYHVTAGPDGHLLWTTETDGKTEVFSSEPDAGFWDRFKIGVIRILPIENQL